jgi:hypothetical protein
MLTVRRIVSVKKFLWRFDGPPGHLSKTATFDACSRDKNVTAAVPHFAITVTGLPVKRWMDIFASLRASTQPRTSRGGGSDASAAFRAQRRRKEAEIRDEERLARRRAGAAVRAAATACVDEQLARFAAEQQQDETLADTRELALRAAVAINLLHSNVDEVFSYRLDPAEMRSRRQESREDEISRVSRPSADPWSLLPARRAAYARMALKLQPDPETCKQFRFAFRKRPKKILSIPMCYERCSALGLSGWRAAACYLRMTYLLIDPVHVDGPPRRAQARRYYRKSLFLLREQAKNSDEEAKRVAKLAPGIGDVKGERELQRRLAVLQEDRLATWQLRREAFEGLARLDLSLGDGTGDESAAARNLNRWLDLAVDRPSPYDPAAVASRNEATASLPTQETSASALDGPDTHHAALPYTYEEVRADRQAELDDLRYISVVVRSSKMLRGPEPAGMEERAAALGSIGPVRDFLIAVLEKIVDDFGRAEDDASIVPLARLLVLRRQYKRAHALLVRTGRPLAVVDEERKFLESRSAKETHQVAALVTSNYAAGTGFRAVSAKKVLPEENSQATDFRENDVSTAVKGAHNIDTFEEKLRGAKPLSAPEAMPVDALSLFGAGRSLRVVQGSKTGEKGVR